MVPFRTHVPWQALLALLVLVLAGCADSAMDATPTGGAMLTTSTKTATAGDLVTLDAAGSMLADAKGGCPNEVYFFSDDAEGADHDETPQTLRTDGACRVTAARFQARMAAGIPGTTRDQKVSIRVEGTAPDGSGLWASTAEAVVRVTTPASTTTTSGPAPAAGASPSPSPTGSPTPSPSPTTPTRPAGATFAWVNDIKPAAAPAASNPPGPEGVSLTPSDTVLVTDTPNDAVQTLTAAGAPVAPFAASFTGAGLSYPRQAVQVSADEVDVSDSFNRRVVRIQPSTKTVIGTLPAPPSGWGIPRGIAVSASGGMVAVADVGDGKAGTGTVDLYSDGAFVRQVTGFTGPEGVGFDADGHLWVANTGDHTIVEVDPGSGGYLSGFDGGEALSAAGEAPLGAPTGVAADNYGDIWVADYGNHRVLGFTPDGKTLLQVITTADGSADQLQSPVTLGFDSHGDLYVAETSGDRVAHYQLTTSHATASAARAGKAGAFQLSAALQAARPKLVTRGRVAYAGGTLSLANAIVTATAKGKLPPAQARRLPAALRKAVKALYSADIVTRLSGRRVLLTPSSWGLAGSGYVLARSRASRRTLVCMRIRTDGATTAGTGWTIAGATGSAARLTGSGSYAPPVLGAAPSTRTLGSALVKLGAKRGVGRCAGLVRYLPKAGR